MRRFRALILAIFVASFCACSGGSGLIAPTALTSVSTPGTADTATRSVALTGGAQVVELPAISGFTGRVTLAAGSTIPAGSSLTLTTSFTAPHAASVQPSSVRPSETTRLTFLSYVTFTVSNTVVLPSLPSFSVTIAPTVSTASPQQFYYAISDPTVTSISVSFRTEGPANVAGQTLIFAGSATPLTLLANKPYVFAFYKTSVYTPVADASIKLYVANAAGNSVSVFDIDHGNIALPPITGGGLDGPTGVVVDASGKVYVANSAATYDGLFGGSTVSVFDTLHGNAALSPVSGGGLNGPIGIAIDRSGKLYVGNASGTVSVFDTVHGNAALAPITGNGLETPEGLVLDATGKLYVADLSGSVSIFDTLHGNAPLPPIPSSDGFVNNAAAALDASGKLYVNNGSGLSVYDTAHGNAVLPSIAGFRGDGLAFDSHGRLYVANGSDRVLIVDVANGGTLLTQITGGWLNGPWGVVIH